MPGSWVTSMTSWSDSSRVPPVTAGAVAARLADHGGGLARDGGLVDRADALDDLAVGGDQVARGDDDDVATLKIRRRHVLDDAVRETPVRDGRRAGRAQGARLCLAAALGHGLRQIGEEHGEPEPDRDRAREPERLLALVAANGVDDEVRRDDDASDLDDEDHRVADQRASGRA